MFCLNEISARLTGLSQGLPAKSAIAITAYLPLVVSFINYPCITVIISEFLVFYYELNKINCRVKTCYKTILFCENNNHY